LSQHGAVAEHMVWSWTLCLQVVALFDNERGVWSWRTI